ncbi:cytochrome P450 3A21-like [Oppia nitens]|uniref:cytochrome P450 3A21-like n=1 Tax=Oppia nitens TaxID=1686743 RepID=UPI0023DBE51C|nr:cytochrome P450 3A21-like [Oppia nitens]
MTDYQKYLTVHNKQMFIVLTKLFLPENMKNIESITDRVFNKFIVTDDLGNENQFSKLYGMSFDRLDIRPVVQKMIMNLLIECSFGQSFAELNLSADRFMQSAPQFDKNRWLLLATMLVPSLTDLVMGFYGKLFGQRQRYFIDSIHKLIRHRWLTMASSSSSSTTDDDGDDVGNNINNNNNNNDTADEKPNNDFLQQFLDYRSRSGDILDDNEIVSLYYVCYLSSYESMTMMLSMLIYQLALNPTVQQRLYDELQQLPVLTNTGTESGTGSTAEAAAAATAKLHELPYLNAVLLETIRLYPSFVANRRAINDVYLTEVGLTVPKGTDVELSFISMFLNPQYFTDPYQFNPDRFMPTATDTIPANVFVPFGIGRATCIGKRFAKVILKQGLAKLVNRFRFSPTTATEIPLTFNRCPDMLLPKSIELKFEMRDKLIVN